MYSSKVQCQVSGFSDLHCSWLCFKHPGRDSYPVDGQVWRSTALPPLSTSRVTQEPLAISLHHSLGAWDLRACTALLHISMVGSLGPSESIFFFTNVLLWIWFAPGTDTRTIAEQEHLAEKTNRATMCFQQCPAVTCFYRTLGN